MPTVETPNNTEEGATMTGGRRSMVVVAPVSTSPELSPRPQRRTYTAKDKLRILTDVDHAAGTGATGAILRREGHYHSNQGWQQARGRVKLTACHDHPTHTTVICSLPRSSATLSGCITCSASACAMLS